MKNNLFVSEVFVACLLLGILFLLFNPVDILMPTSLSMMLIIGFIVAFLLFAGIIWKEKARDEREDLHRSLAGRTSFIVGLLVLATGVVVQSLGHNIDPWLVYALVAMTLTKIASRIYSQFRH